MNLLTYFNYLRKHKLLNIFIILSIIIHFKIFGDWNHYHDFLIGERAAAMGGAYTAISDDPTGLYYNPGGIVFSKDKEISLSSVGYYLNSQSVNSIYGIKNYQGTQTNSDILNVFFGFTTKVTLFSDDFYIGFAVYVPDNTNIYTQVNFNNISNIQIGKNTISVRSFISTLREVGKESIYSVSISKKIKENLGLGLSIGFFDRQGNGISTNNITFGPFLSYLSQDINYSTSDVNNYSMFIRGIHFNIGALYKLLNNLSFGFSMNYKLPILQNYTASALESASVVNSNGVSLGTVQEYNFDQYNNKYTSFSKNSFVDQLPIQMRYGIAWRPFDITLLSFDVIYYTGIHSDIDYYNLKPILNYSFGSETKIIENLAFRFGLFTNNWAGAKTEPEEIINSDYKGITGGLALDYNKSIFSIAAVYQKSFNASYSTYAYASQGKYPSVDCYSYSLLLGITSYL
ncbi:MAG: hypothetical protein K2X69_04560 [Silvanigrellaceae bacterium]|nr:hypothetical protein [Silvanigrellaceae bacterium]